MKKFNYISLALIGAMLLLFSESAIAQRYYHQTYRPRTRSHVRDRDGFNTEGFSFGANVLYYFGDADGGKIPLVQGFDAQDISADGFFMYHRPFNEWVGLRCGANLGVLKGDNSKYWAKDGKHDGQYRKFTSIFLQPCAGIQIYPIEEIGFNFYVGVGFTGSYFLKSDFSNVAPNAIPKFSFMPMGQVSIGYDWNLDSDWRMGLNAGFQMGFFDIRGWNLDGWPYKTTVTNDWPDGMFSLGLTFFHKSPNSYGGPRRRSHYRRR